MKTGGEGIGRGGGAHASNLPKSRVAHPFVPNKNKLGHVVTTISMSN